MAKSKNRGRLLHCTSLGGAALVEKITKIARAYSRMTDAGNGISACGSIVWLLAGQMTMLQLENKGWTAGYMMMASAGLMVRTPDCVKPSLPRAAPWEWERGP
jgi:hypothetical protein